MHPEPARRILVVKLADLGDVLVSEPALRSLRLGFPSARIDLLVPPGCAELARLLGHDLHVLTFPKSLFDQPAGFLRPDCLRMAARLTRHLRRAHYDSVVLLHHLTTRAGALKFRALVAATGSRHVVGLDNGRGTFLSRSAPDLGFGARHESEYMLDVARAAGGESVDPHPRFHVEPSELACSLPDRYAVLYPATGPYASARTWPAQRFASVARELAASGMRTVIVGARDASSAAQMISAAVPDAVDLTGRTSIFELAQVLTRAAVVVGGDSFIGHLAGALDRPVVTIFGPSNRHAWRPYGAVDVSQVDLGASSLPRGVVVYHDLPCEPCIYTGYSLGRPSGCPSRTCLQRVSAGAVAEVVKRIAEVS